jgi:hypothetical protein
VFLYFFSYVIPYRLCCTLFTEILSLKMWTWWRPAHLLSPPYLKH